LCVARFGAKANGYDEQANACLRARKRGCFHGNYGLRL
jgi:hypothetical protein